MDGADSQEYEIIEQYKMQLNGSYFEEPERSTIQPNNSDKCEVEMRDKVRTKSASNMKKANIFTIVFLFIMLMLTLLSVTLSASVYIENMKIKNKIDLLVEDILPVNISAKGKIEDLENDFHAVQFNQISSLIENLTAYFNSHYLSINGSNIENPDIIQEINYDSTDIQLGLNYFTANVTQDMQEVLLFESCTAISNLSLPFSCGVYNIRNSDYSYAQAYCQLNCTDTFEGWRRVAYLNVSDTTASSCPGNLMQNTQPLSCTRSYMVPGCSSIIFSSSSITYSKIIGRVQGYLQFSPDGFRNHGDVRPTHPTLDENYVDGISLTYGSPRKHIWTFAATTHSSSKNCTLCSINKPDYVGSHYSCDDVFRTSYSSLRNSGWSGDGSQCAGDRYFYRQLPLPTSEDIEMRLCTDEPSSNEQIFITHLEIYVQ